METLNFHPNTVGRLMKGYEKYMLFDKAANVFTIQGLNGAEDAHSVAAILKFAPDGGGNYTVSDTGSNTSIEVKPGTALAAFLANKNVNFAGSTDLLITNGLTRP